MPRKFALSLALLLGAMNLSGCVAAVGAGAVVVADEVAERDRGGDGLF